MKLFNYQNIYNYLCKYKRTLYSCSCDVDKEFDECESCNINFGKKCSRHRKDGEFLQKGFVMSDILTINFDKFVHNEYKIFKSVDSLYVCDNYIYFIEFKPSISKYLTDLKDKYFSSVLIFALKEEINDIMSFMKEHIKLFFVYNDKSISKNNTNGAEDKIFNDASKFDLKDRIKINNLENLRDNFTNELFVIDQNEFLSYLENNKIMYEALNSKAYIK